MKKLIYLIIVCSIIFYFIFDASEAFIASQNGLYLWFNQILPTLLPFSILSSVLLSSELFSGFNTKESLVSANNACEAFIIISGFLFGFPIGSKLASDCKTRKILNRNRAQILCSFTNNLSPTFIIQFVIMQNLKQPSLQIPTMCILYGPPLLIGLLMLLFASKESVVHKKTASRFQLNMQIIDAGIINGFETLIKLCGYIIIFSILISLFSKISIFKTEIGQIAIANMEVTNGIHLISKCNLPFFIKYPIVIGILSFGGLCGLAQTGSMIHTSELSLKNYVKMKIIYTLCSVSLAILYELLF